MSGISWPRGKRRTDIRADGVLDRIHRALYVECREKAEREESLTAAIIDSQNVKSAKKGRPASIRISSMRRGESDQSTWNQSAISITYMFAFLSRAEHQSPLCMLTGVRDAHYERLYNLYAFLGP